MRPLRVADRGAAGPVRTDTVLVEPAPDIVVEELLAPEHARQRLAHDTRSIGREARRRDRGIKGVGLPPTRLDDRVEVAEGPPRERDEVVARQPQPDPDTLTRVHGDAVMRGDLGAGLGGIDRIGPAVHEIVVDRILHPGTAVGCAEDPLGVGLVFGEEQRRPFVTVEVPFAELGVRRRHHAHASWALESPQSELGHLAAP